jgi:hypothetical protein
MIYKVLVAETGDAPGDFNFTEPGELVDLPEWGGCQCGCDKALIGLRSAKGTTFAVVREVDLSAAEVKALGSTLARLVELAGDCPVGSGIRVQAQEHGAWEIYDEEWE